MTGFRLAQWFIFFALTLVGLIDFKPAQLDTIYNGVSKALPDSAVTAELANFIAENPAQAAEIFVLMTALMQAFAIPSWIINFWESCMAAFFPFYTAVLCLVLGKVLGSALAYIASKMLLSKAFHAEEGDRLEYFQQLVTKYSDGRLMMFLTRLQMNNDTLFPPSFVNYAAPVSKVPLHLIILSSAIASLPQAATTVTLGRLYPSVNALLAGKKSYHKIQFELVFITAVLKWAPAAICKQLTRDFSNDLRYGDKSWRLPKRLHKTSLATLAKSTSALAQACASDPRGLLSTLKATCGQWSRAFVCPRWAPSLSLTALAGDDDSSEESYADINEALRNITERDDKLPGDHRHLLFDNIDPIYEEKYCPELRVSDMKDSVTSVTPYSIVDRADSLGILLDDYNDKSDFQKPMEQPNWRDSNYFNEEDFKQVVRLYTPEEEMTTKRVWDQGAWKTEYMMQSKSSSCPYVNRLKEKQMKKRPGLDW